MKHFLEFFKTNWQSIIIALAMCSTAAVYTADEFTVTAQAATITLVWASVIVGTFGGSRSSPDSDSERVAFRRAAYFVLAVALLTLLPLARSSNFNGIQDQLTTVFYAVALIVTMGLFLVHIRIKGVSILLRSFVFSAFFGSFGYLYLANSQGQFSEIADVSQRFTVGGLHPNLLGFCNAGFFVFALAALYFGRGIIWWVTFFATGVVSLATIYLASSRGSIVGVVVALASIIVLKVCRLTRDAINGDASAAIKVSGYFLVGLIVIVLSYLAWDEILGSSVTASVTDRLEVFSQYRGIDSGLTGRLETWTWVYKQYTATDFWLGVGPRKSSLIAGDIDNGFIVIILENGLVLGTLIIIRFFYVFGYFSWVAITSRDRLESLLAVSFTVCGTAYLINNIVARYLFGIGNPFCLWGVLMFTAGPYILKRATKELRASVNRSAKPRPSGAPRDFLLSSLR